MRPQLLFAVIALALIAASCSDAPSNPDPSTNKPARLMPLAAGNSWTYHYTGPTGNTADTRLSLVESVKRPYNNHKGFVGNFDFITTNVTQMTPANSWMWNEDTLVAGNWIGLQPYGDTVRMLFQIQNEPAIVASAPNIGYAVIAQESVTVPAGTFTDCYLHRYNATPSQYQVDTWYKRGVGIVKQVKRDKGAVKETWELKSYTLK